MPRRASIFLLTLCVLVTNAYCACNSVARHGMKVYSHPGCHGHIPKTKGPHREEHTCTTCMGSAADAALGAGDSPMALPALSHGILSDLVNVTPPVQDSKQRWDHTGLSPPDQPATLLSLACSFTN